MIYKSLFRECVLSEPMKEALQRLDIAMGRLGALTATRSEARALPSLPEEDLRILREENQKLNSLLQTTQKKHRELYDTFLHAQKEVDDCLNMLDMLRETGARSS